MARKIIAKKENNSTGGVKVGGRKKKGANRGQLKVDGLGDYFNPDDNAGLANTTQESAVMCGQPRQSLSAAKMEPRNTEKAGKKKSGCC